MGRSLFSYNSGWMEIITGPVKSGKSSALIGKISSFINAIDKERLKKELLIIKHPLDDKNTTKKISSFNKEQVDATESKTADNLVNLINKNTKYIFISGIHHFDDNIVPLCKALINTGRTIIATGINLTSEGKPYKNMPELMTLSDSYEIRTGECFNCGNNAYRTIKIKDKFEPRCMKCYYNSEKEPSLTVVAGPMFSSKTIELITEINQKRNKIEQRPIKNYTNEFMNKDISAIFKWSKDKRYSSKKIVSHNGNSIDAILVEKIDEIIDYLKRNPQIGFVGVDEIQFFDNSYYLVNNLLKKGYDIFVTCLKKDFRGEGFGDVPKILTLANTIINKEAYCTRCQKQPATETQRFIIKNGIKTPANYNDPVVLVGGKESYTAVCRSCHWVPGKPENKYYNILKLKNIN